MMGVLVPQNGAFAMRKCTRCGVSKTLEEFSYRNKAKEVRSGTCKECCRAQIRQHYQNNTDQYLEKAHRRNAAIRVEARTKLYYYLQEQGCVDCGEKDPVVLELDHRDAADKAGSIADLVGLGWSWPRILEEIKKCDVRCANCHRRRTAKQFGWYKYIPS
jgi:hypothetical protein